MIIASLNANSKVSRMRQKANCLPQLLFGREIIPSGARIRKKLWRFYFKYPE
jgi:hypothetical protein